MVQRGATGQKSEILKHTGTSLLMQPAVGPAKHMTGILMVAETQDSHGKPFVLVVPDVSVYNPTISYPSGLSYSSRFFGQPQNPISGQRGWTFPQSRSALRWHHHET